MDNYTAAETDISANLSTYGFEYFLECKGVILKTIRLIMVSLLTVTFIFGVYGCMANGIGFNFGKKTLTDRMVDYMNETYPEDEFAYAAPWGGGAGISGKSIVVSSRNFPDSGIYVYYSRDGENEEFFDNYIGVKYEAQTVALLRAIMRQVVDGDDYFLEYGVGTHDCPAGDGNMSFEEYVSLKESHIGFNAVVSADLLDREQFEADFTTALIQAGICSMGQIYFAKDLETVRSMTEADFSLMIYHKTYIDQLFFVMQDSTEFAEMTWGDGRG